MSELVTNKITPGTGSSDTVTLGDSGDTFSIPSGATIANSGTATGFLPAAGTSGNVLTSDGTNWASAAGGGAWNIIGTNEFSSTTSVTITGLDSTYDTYAIALSNCTIATDHNNIGIRLGDSSGIDSGTADYSFHTSIGDSGSTSYVGIADADTDYIFYNNSMGNATGEGAGLMIYLHRPGDGAVFPIISGTHVTVRNNGTTSGGAVTGQRLSVITVDRINLYERGSANMSGRLTVYGIAHA